MSRIDLRSDTVTQPTPEMRRAMAEADLGDDVYGEDPTVNKLEAVAARMLGKEAALFVPTGTMGNQAAVYAHTQRGDEVIIEAEAHIFFFEVAGLAVLSAVQALTLQGEHGHMSPAAVEAAIRPENIHCPRTGLICLENTHNRAGGTIHPQEHVEAICALAHRRGIPVHLDGARLFNAAVARGKTVAELAAPVDSVMVALSKGLACPAGSLVAGRREFIARARQARKLLGGGMRQAGVLAAAGLVALETMVERLAEDHANALLLAEGLNAVPGLRVDMATVQTNIVSLTVEAAGWDAPRLVQVMRQRGVLANATRPHTIRLVTHLDISAAGCRAAAEVVRAILAGGPPSAGRQPA